MTADRKKGKLNNTVGGNNKDHEEAKN